MTPGSVVAVLPLWAAVLAFAEATTTKPSEKYVLTLHSVFGAEPQRWVFLLKTPDGGIGITSSDRLQSYIELMVPKNATLEWVPTCTTKGEEPMRTQAELDAFAEFCAKHGIKLVVIPAG